MLTWVVPRRFQLSRPPYRSSHWCSEIPRFRPAICSWVPKNWSWERRCGARRSMPFNGWTLDPRDQAGGEIPEPGWWVGSDLASRLGPGVRGSRCAAGGVARL